MDARFEALVCLVCGDGIMQRQSWRTDYKSGLYRLNYYVFTESWQISGIGQHLVEKHSYVPFDKDLAAIGYYHDELADQEEGILGSLSLQVTLGY
ncbi:hypothetical protein AWENTII_011095 [Aspergillus wentii]|nr:hypothetical protein MW887_003616 [Aspergillus wentii]